MCFWEGDYDWVATVAEWSEGQANGATRCDECHRDIPEGATVHRLFMQEHEECRTCCDGECECPKDEDGDCPVCCCPDPDFGESQDYGRCEDCHAFLRAVEAAEIEEGCKPHEARPRLTSMVEDIREAGRLWERKRYLKKAVAMFPDRKAYLAWLWRERLS